MGLSAVVAMTVTAIVWTASHFSYDVPTMGTILADASYSCRTGSVTIDTDFRGDACPWTRLFHLPVPSRDIWRVDQAPRHASTLIIPCSVDPLAVERFA